MPYISSEGAPLSAVHAPVGPDKPTLEVPDGGNVVTDEPVELAPVTAVSDAEPVADGDNSCDMQPVTSALAVVVVINEPANDDDEDEVEDEDSGVGSSCAWCCCCCWCWN